MPERVVENLPTLTPQWAEDYASDDGTAPENRNLSSAIQKEQKERRMKDGGMQEERTRSEKGMQTREIETGRARKKQQDRKIRNDRAAEKKIAKKKEPEK